MPGRSGSPDSFDEFFDETKTDQENTKSSTIASLIRNQPVLHHRRTPSVTKSTTNSNKTPMTTTNKSKVIETPPSKIDETDFDENTSGDEKKKVGSLPPPTKISSPQETPRRRSDSKIKRSFTIHNRRTERTLPYIRPKNRQKKSIQKPKSQVEERLHSAQQEKKNQLQSRLNELRRLIEGERMENRALRIIQKREENALKKFEDQEYDVHRVAKDYNVEIRQIKEKVQKEQDGKIKLEKEIESQNEILRDQNKRMKFYQKLVNEPELDDVEELRRRLKETDKKLKKFETKITNTEKQIEDLQENYRQEIHDELVKQYQLKKEIANEGRKYSDLLVRFEEKSRQVGTMHIYIQHGGRRPSISSMMHLSKSRSLQSLEETSPRLREKILEYDKRRREEEKLRPKPKLRPLPTSPPPKPERKKYVPSIDLKPKVKPKKIPAIPQRSPSPSPRSLPPLIEKERTPEKIRPTVRRLSTPEAIEPPPSPPRRPVRRISTPSIVDEPIREKSLSPSPPPPPPIPAIQRNEEHVTKAPTQKVPLSPIIPPIERKASPNGIPTKASIYKRPSIDDKWSDLFDTNKQDKSDEVTVLPSNKSTAASMITFEPTSVANNGVRKRSIPRQHSNSVYDFDQAIINLHEGKPVTTQSTITTTITKTSNDPFEALFNNNTTKSSHRLANRDDTFTTAQDKTDPFETFLTQTSTTMPAATASNSSTVIKPTIRQIPASNDRLQRPKVISNTPKPIANRTVVEEIEEFFA